MPQLPDDPLATVIASLRFGKGCILVLINRADHWQVRYFLLAGDYPKLHARRAMRRNIVLLKPCFADNV